MLFNVNVSPAQVGAPNFSVQIEAPDIVSALEAAKAPILKSALDSASIISAVLPDRKPAGPIEAPAA